jgi:hypothetical protein
MTRAAWLEALRQRGVRVSLEGEPGRLRVRGVAKLTAADQRRLDRDKRGVLRLLKQRQRRVEQQAIDLVVEALDAPVIVGERLTHLGGAWGERKVEPIYADGSEGSVLVARLLFQELQERWRDRDW